MLRAKPLSGPEGEASKPDDIERWVKDQLRPRVGTLAANSIPGMSN
jgi:hypothetical protein